MKSKKKQHRKEEGWRGMNRGKRNKGKGRRTRDGDRDEGCGCMRKNRGR